MRKIFSWSLLFVLLSSLLLLSGCGGGGSNNGLDGGNSSNSNSTPNIDTNDEPDTYNIAEIANGEWVGVSGTGTATGYGGTYDLVMTTCRFTLKDTSVSGNTGTTVDVGYINWDAYTRSGLYVATVKLYDDEDTLATMIHVGANTWRFESSNNNNGQVTIVKIISETTIELSQTGRVNIDGYFYSYSYNATLRKDSSVTTSPDPDIIPEDPEPTNPSNPSIDTYTDTYDISQLLAGSWIGNGGTGTATGHDGTFYLTMLTLKAEITNTQISGETGTMLLNGQQNWDVATQSGGYVTNMILYSENDTMTLTHVGVNNWSCEYPNGTIITILMTSENTAVATQRGTVMIYGYMYDYYINLGLVRDVNSSDTSQDDNPEKNPDLTPDVNPIVDPDTQQEENNGEYDISIISGFWSASNKGSGTITSADETFALEMNSDLFWFWDLQYEEDTVTAKFSSYWYWFPSSGSELYMLASFSYLYQEENIKIQRVGVNTWRYLMPNTENKVTFEFLSENEIFVQEEGEIEVSPYYTLRGYKFPYKVEYNMIKKRSYDEITPHP